MAFQHKEMRGSLFPNDRKTAGSKQPDHKGSAMINGQLFYISAWSEKSQGGKQYVSLSFSFPQEASPPSVQNKLDDPDVPF